MFLKGTNVRRRTTKGSNVRLNVFGSVLSFFFVTPSKMDDQEEIDCGAYYQVPILHLLRNVCTPLFAKIAVKEFKKKLLSDKTFSESRGKSIFEFYRKINNKGKKLEVQRNKRQESGQENERLSRTLHLANVKEYEKDLERFTPNDFLMEDKEDELIQCFSGFDVKFLLDLITNQILDYQLPPDLLIEINSVKRIRNVVFHYGRKKDYLEFEKKFKELCDILRRLYEILKEDCIELERKIEEASQELNPLKKRMIIEDMHKELKEDEMAKFHSRCESYIKIPMKDARENSVEDFEQFLEHTKQPVVLCGPSGSGKSTALQRLSHKFYAEENSMKYDLVIILNSPYRLLDHSLNSGDMHDAIKRKMFRSCRETVRKHTIDMCLFILMNCGNFLFLVDYNINSNDVRGDRLRGKWVFCSSCLHTEWSPYYCVLNIDRLNEQSVKELLSTLTSSTESKDVISLYESCEYKCLINSPDMVIAFKEVKEKKYVNVLLQSYLDKKVSSVENSDAHCKILGKKAFEFIVNNKMEYSDNDLCGVSDELISPLFVKHKNSHVFNLRVIEDFLAAKYVAANPAEARKDWVRQISPMTRVFRFVCAIWNESNTLQKNLHHLESYLAKYIGAKKGTFTHWPFLISVAEYCQFQADMMKLICKLLVQKTYWVIKCKFINDERKTKALFRLLENVQLSKQITIKIESGFQRTTLCDIWDKLSCIPGLHNYANIQIAIMHKHTKPVPCDSYISRLPSKILQVDKLLFITKYEGPFLCSGTEGFLECQSMTHLEVLDVTVYDIASLAGALSCEGLCNLKAVVIKIELTSSMCKSIKDHNLRFPSLPATVSFDIYIKYFDEMQELLRSFANKEELHALTIRGMYIKENFALDLFDFTALEALYINFDNYAARPSNIPEEHTLSSSQPFDFFRESKLPENLQRLMLRDAVFCNDRNIFFVGNNSVMGKYAIQRLILLDSDVSIMGLKNIFSSHIDVPIEERFKRQCVSREETKSSEDKPKKPRLSEEEREMRRRNKPNGKELIITSNLKMCNMCKKFPCDCQQLDSEPQDSLDDVVELIKKAYYYDILSLSYTSDFITVRKDLCGDLRVRCPLTDLTDDIMDNYVRNEQVRTQSEQQLRSFFEILYLAQSITLDCTRLTLNGAREVIDKIIQLKTKMCFCKEPFSLTISSFEYCIVGDEVKKSRFLGSLVEEDYLQQFKFCHCEDKSKYIRKTLKKEIVINGEYIEP
ncbi:uncharacterized protein [Macrobrachium rosenbergii]|uniref:uncharacterized protein isoform X3 n=1 Tax=Macrobrachium rosenbergii TaxID=79674 RepID=UPI0034D39A47